MSELAPMSVDPGNSPLALEEIGAAYLHARSPSDARIAFWHETGADISAALPPELIAHLGNVDLQILLPVEESTLRPVLRPTRRG